MKKLTIAFYEYPAALREIEFWESLKASEIEEYEKSNKDIKFTLKDEILFCTPIDKPNVQRIYELLDVHEYYKTLIFGKVTLVDLQCISAHVMKFENRKLCTRK